MTRALKGMAGFFVLVMIAGCGKQMIVPYDEIRNSNYAEVSLVSGKKISGTVQKTEPHQITLLTADRGIQTIPKASIVRIRIKPPVYDDFGKGISEEEIKEEQTSKNTLIYGLGGGALSLGASFFLGSMVSQDSTVGNSVLYGTTAAGGTIGTVLFLRAGKAKDRQEAIERIRERRVEEGETRTEPAVEKQKSDEELQRLIEAEKERQESLQKEREELLKELNKKKEKEKG